jgi:hypothetical protein
VGSNPTTGTVGGGTDNASVPHIRPLATVQSALAASDAGMPDAENAARHGVAVKTIRRWRRLYQRRGLPRGQQHMAPPCPRCDGAPLDESAYAELLGWYLGDGHISLGRRGVYALHIYNDERYVVLNQGIKQLMRRVKPGSRPHTRRMPGCINTTASWKHWPCLFPQHGSGRKHERPIRLERWQQRIVHHHAAELLRGLFHSDGCRSNNWTTRNVAGERKRYDYPRWEFVNSSDDIIDICTTALDRIAVRWTRPKVNSISVARGPDVRLLDELIGPKA